jgi:hypothetical protein
MIMFLTGWWNSHFPRCLKNEEVRKVRRTPLPSLPQRIGKLVGKFPFSIDTRFVRFRKRDGLDITEANTLWVSVTIITLHRDPILDIKERMAKGASNDAGSASDAQPLINGYPVIIFRLPVAGLCRTHFHTIGLFAMIAGHGKIKPHVLPLDHFDPGPAWIAGPCVKHGTHHLAKATSGTLLLIDNQYLFLHPNPPTLTQK